MNKSLTALLFFLISLITGANAYADTPEKVVLKSISVGQTKMLGIFLDGGANINAMYDNGKTTLLNYAIREGNIEAVKLLVVRGADLNIANKGKTPLINAVQKKELMILHHLIQHGADIDAMVRNGNTALIFAARSGRLDCVRILVENGADVEHKNENGLTALDFANMANYPLVAKYLVKIIEMRNYYTEMPDYTDGPHFDWVDDTTVKMFYMMYDTTIHYPVKKENFIVVKSDSISIKGFAGDTRNYTIIKGFDTEPCEFQNVSKVLAIGDIHGHYSALSAYLKLNNIIDDNDNWIWGNGHIVFLGDVFDRGSEVTESLWFIYGLDLKARKHRGRVHMLLGNHEVMVMGNDTRYLNRKYELFSNYFTRDYADFYNMNSVLGNWLRTRNTVIKINDCLFSHAGISPEVLDRKIGIESINAVLHEYLDGNPEKPMQDAELANLVLNANGPLWYRGYVLDGFGGNSITDKQVEAIIKFYKVDKMILAHTEVKKMTSLFDGKVIAIDIPIRTELALPEALLIKDGKFFRLTCENEKIPCSLEILSEKP